MFSVQAAHSLRTGEGIDVTRFWTCEEGRSSWAVVVAPKQYIERYLSTPKFMAVVEISRSVHAEQVDLGLR